MKKKRNKETNRANEAHRNTEKKADNQPMSANPAADLEQSLKSRMGSMRYRGLIRDIRVSECPLEGSLSI